jgi:hypothetical protein
VKKLIKLVLMFAFYLGASAHAYVFTSTMQQSGYAGNLNFTGVDITSSPFDFHGQPFERIDTIGNLWITLTVYDGDTDDGDFDSDSVFYFINNFNGQTFANFFPNDALKTFTQIKRGTSIFRDFFPQITSSIRDTGFATITLVDFTPGSVNYIELPSAYQATLKFEATLLPVPEAPIAAMFALGLALVRVAVRLKK